VPSYTDFSGTTNAWNVGGGDLTVSSGNIVGAIATLTDAATVTPNLDLGDVGILTSLSQATNFANYTGTPVNGQKYLLRIKSSTARALTWGTNYVAASGLALPTTTTGGSVEDFFLFLYSSDLTKLVMVSTTVGDASLGVTALQSVGYSMLKL